LIDLLLNTLAAGLTLLNTKESQRYLKQLAQLKQDYYEEYNKEISDDNVLDTIDIKLRIIGEAFINQTRIKDS